MKKIISCILMLLLILFLLNGCSDANTDKNKLIVFAASSMYDSLNEIKNLYEEKHQDVEIVYNFDSSGTLKTVIEHGADCDVFISASQKPMDQLDVTANLDSDNDKLDFILTDSRINLLENKVVLAVSSNSKGKIESFDDMAYKLKKGDIFMAIGNSDVPAGEYAYSILNYYGISTQELDKNSLVTYGSNAKEVTTYVSQGVVDCGIVYQTDARTAGLTVVDSATINMCGRVIYPAAVINTSKNVKYAKVFLDFLTTQEAQIIFEKYGFTVIE